MKQQEHNCSTSLLQEQSQSFHFWIAGSKLYTFCNIPEGFEAKAALGIQPNISSIVKVLNQFFEMNDEERETMGVNGYNLVKSSFTWKEAAQKMDLLYDYLVNGGDKPEFVYL